MLTCYLTLDTMDQDDLTQLGRRLREAREALAATDRRRFSVRALAARLGVAGAYLSGLERGLQRPPSPCSVRRRPPRAGGRGPRWRRQEGGGVVGGPLASARQGLKALASWIATRRR